MGFSFWMRGFTALPRKRPHILCLPWVAVSGSGTVASGPFFGMRLLDFMGAAFVSCMGHFRRLDFNFLTFPALRR
jgi:hypothetical protein